MKDNANSSRCILMTTSAACDGDVIYKLWSCSKFNVCRTMFKYKVACGGADINRTIFAGKSPFAVFVVFLTFTVLLINIVAYVFFSDKPLRGHDAP